MTTGRKAALVAGVSLSVIGACACAGAASAADATAPAAEAVATNTAAPAPEAAAATVGEVIITAQRRNESAQRVPMTVQAFTGATLSQLNVTNFDDLLKYTPNVTFASNGPGQGEIYMRGLSTGFRGNQSSSTVGTFPNVAIYLDDQSMSFPGRNADIYMVDMQRVEVLEGPQGTLFGGGAEAGAVRYITNKPKLDTFEGSAEGQYGFTSGGGQNSALNAVINVPIIKDKLAVRAVVYNDQQGGYITTEPSTFTRSNADLGNYYFGLSPNANGVCPNGLPKSGSNGCTVANSQQAQINNQALVKRDSNPVTYNGARVSALYQINPDWDVLITESFQNLDAEGLSVEYPTGSDFQPLGQLRNTEFEPSYNKDQYENTAWTVNGKVGDLKVIYTGGYTDRHISEQMDYTNYSRTGGGTYYECTGGAGSLLGAGKGQPVTCYSPLGYWQDSVHSTHLSNELRVSSPDTWRLRFIAGAYEEQFRIYDVMNFNYKSIPSCTPANLAAAQAGATPCLADVRTDPGTTANDPGVRSASTGFGEDTQRGFDQTALFGSIDFDIIPKVLTLTAGTRWYDYSDFEVGSVYESGGGCLNVPNGQCAAREMININSHHDNVTYTGFKSHFGLTWHPSANSTLYYTFSQGFRPGSFIRYQKDVINGPDGKPQYLEPNSVAPDSLTNNEIGYKGEFFDHRLMLNLSAYYMEWKNSQFMIYNPTEGINTTFALNGADYDVKGVEAQWAVKVTHGLTIQGSATYNDDTQANSPCLTDNEAGTPAFGKCISTVLLSNGTVQPFNNPFGEKGSILPYSPEWQGNLRARYEWTVADDYKAHVMIGGNFVGSMWNQPSDYPSGAGVLIPSTTYLRYEMPAYGTLDASVGVAKDNWYAELYGTNLADSHASTFTSSAQFIKSEVPLRPTVIMLKVGAHF